MELTFEVAILGILGNLLSPIAGAVSGIVGGISSIFGGGGGQQQKHVAPIAASHWQPPWPSAYTGQPMIPQSPWRGWSQPSFYQGRGPNGWF